MLTHDQQIRTHDQQIAGEYVETDPFALRSLRALQLRLARAQAVIRVLRTENSKLKTQN